MKCNTIKLEYNKREEVLFAGTIVIVEKVPMYALEAISKQYHVEITHEGIAHFIEMDFGDVCLKFKFEGTVKKEVVENSGKSAENNK